VFAATLIEVAQCGKPNSCYSVIQSSARLPSQSFDAWELQPLLVDGMDVCSRIGSEACMVCTLCMSARAITALSRWQPVRGRNACGAPPRRAKCVSWEFLHPFSFSAL
jgi:hypothetical protein